VAFTANSASEGYLLEALQGAGLKLSDIVPVNVPGTAINSVLSSGEADAAVLASVQVLTALAQDPTDVRLSAPNAYTYTLLVATQSALANPAKRAAIAAFVARAVKAGAWVNAHPASYIAQALVGIDHFPAALAQAYWNLIGDPNWGPVSSAVVAHQQNQANLLVGAGVFQYYASTTKLANSEFNAAINKQINAAIVAAAK
jgi:sulfonate transport system substrate-binding protein